MTKLYNKCGICKFFVQHICANMRSISFGEKILETYFSCDKFQQVEAGTQLTLILPKDIKYELKDLMRS